MLAAVPPPTLQQQLEAEIEAEVLDRTWFKQTLAEAFISSIGTGVGLALGAWIAARFFGIKG